MQHPRRASLVVALLTAALSGSRDARAEDGGVLVVPAARFAVGPALHLAPVAEANHVDVALEATAGVDVVLGPRAAKSATGLLLNPELGYTYDGLGLHAFNATLGVGLSLYGLIGLTYNPRLLVGTWNGDAVGMRNGIAMKVLADTASLEIGHQFLADDLGIHHSASFLFAVNPGALAYVMYRVVTK